MGTTIFLRDVVGVAKHAFLITVIPLHGDFNDVAIFFGSEMKHGVVYRLLVGIQVFDEGTNAANVLKAVFASIAVVG